MAKYLIEPTMISNGRAQLTICELEDRTTYWVDYLDSSFPPKTSFASAGEKLYYGSSLDDALRIVRLVFGSKVKLPAALLKQGP